MALMKQNHLLSNSCKLGRFFILVLLYCLFSLADTAVARESAKGPYPSRPIRIMVPAAAGGSLGNEIRALAPFLEKSLGVPMVIDYVTGADGMIAYNKFATEKSDGYTIMYFNLIAALPLELTRETAKYAVKDYAAVGGWNVKYQVLLVHPDTWKNFADFLGDAKKRSLSLAGTGGHTVLNVRLLESSLGVKFNLVPFKSSGEGIAAVAGKHVDCMLTYETTPKPMIQAGKLRPLAVLSLKPDAILPTVPNLKLLGHENVPILPANGVIAAPPHTPKEITAVLEKALSKATAAPEFKKIAENLGMFVDFMPATELQKTTLDIYGILNKNKQFIQ